MLILQNISYTHPNKDLLFDNINLILNNHDKVALIGNNGVGKSTLFKIISGEIASFGGQLQVDTTPYFIPQIFGQYNHLTVAQALHIDDKLNALKEILEGKVTGENMDILDDDWTIEERCKEAMEYWQLTELELSQKMETLSGGQKTKVFLAGIYIHKPEFILLDEPSNHLDVAGRRLLYDFVENTSATLLIISHDRKLLNLLGIVCELSRLGITVYGGNYDFYAEQKQAEQEALSHDIRSKEKALRKAKEQERESVERQQKLNARGKKKQEKAGVPKIMMNTLRNKAENSTARLKGVHTEKIGDISQDLQDLRSGLPDIDKMKFGFDNSALHRGKIIFRAANINFSYGKWTGPNDGKMDDSAGMLPLWAKNLSFQITSGERIAIKGVNGSGKTTLIKIILDELKPQEGSVYQADICSVYIDQDYSLIKDKLTVYEQAQQYNDAGLAESDVKSRLKRFLFTKEDWNKLCSALSGGERMRLMLCCLTIHNHAPDMIILDEPTNNLDIQNIGILTAAINEYQGTLIVISHDESFLEEIGVSRSIEM